MSRARLLQLLFPNRGRRRPRGQTKSHSAFATESPKELIRLAKTANKNGDFSIVAQSIGKWMRASAIIRDISTRNSHAIIWTRDPHLTADFEQSWAERLQLLQPGHKITLVGRIAKITPFEVELEACRLD